MPLSLYEATVPPVVAVLESLKSIIEKAAAHCEAKGIDPQVLTGARLYPDMFPFIRQVQIATDQAKGMTARLAGVDIPVFADDETTFQQLSARIDKTLDFIKSVPREKFQGAEDKELVVKIRTYEFKAVGQSYVFEWVLPNFYFHATTAYNILRHNGVEIGKKDYLGSMWPF